MKVPNIGWQEPKFWWIKCLGDRGLILLDLDLATDVSQRATKLGVSYHKYIELLALADIDRSNESDPD